MARGWGIARYLLRAAGGKAGPRRAPQAEELSGLPVTKHLLSESNESPLGSAEVEVPSLRFRAPLTGAPGSGTVRAEQNALLSGRVPSAENTWQRCPPFGQGAPTRAAQSRSPPPSSPPCCKAGKQLQEPLVGVGWGVWGGGGGHQVEGKGQTE